MALEGQTNAFAHHQSTFEVTTSSATWLPTPDAARTLGVSVTTLKRYRDANGGFLEAGTHYAFGAFPNSPIAWNVDACRAAMHRRGQLSRQAVAVLADMTR